MIDEISRGVSPFIACKLANVTYGTFRRWMRLGNAGYEPYYDFMLRIELAQENAGVSYDAAYVGDMVETRGRKPDVITCEQQQIILQGIAQGKSFRESAIDADISYSTLKSWLRQGGYSRKLTEAAPIPFPLAREPYRTFVSNVKKAEMSISHSSVRN